MSRATKAAPQGPMLRIAYDEVTVDGDVEIDWSKGKAGKAALKLKVRVGIETIEQAEGLEDVLPGTTPVFDAGLAHEAQHEDADVPEPIGCHVQRTTWPGDLTWRVVALGDTGPIDGPGTAVIEGDAPVRSLTVTASKGVVTCTLGIAMEVPIAQLQAAIALDAQRVRLMGRNPQLDLLRRGAEGEAEPEAGRKPDLKVVRRKASGDDELDELPAEPGEDE